MNKQEFMSQLESLLLYLPIMEREEALQYYDDYFEDAGVENEQEVIAALGNPAVVAENIKNDFYRTKFEDDLEPVRVEPGKEISKYAPLPEEIHKPDRKKKMSTEKLIVIIIICVLLSPVIIGVAGALFGVVVSMISVVVSLVASAGGVALACFFAGIVLTVTGIMATGSNIMAGIGIIGCGLILLAIGFLFLLLEVLLVGKVIPMICRGIGKLFRKKKKM